MSTPCFNHPDVPAVGSCVQCGTPGCAQCLQQVAGRSVCQRCVGAIRARLAQQGVAGPQGPLPQGQVPQGVPPPYSPSAPAYGGAAPAAPAPADTRQVLLGIALGGVIGIIGAILIEKILFYAGFGLSLLYVLLGYGIGWGIHRVTGRGGSGLALAAVGVMVVCLGVAHLVMAQDFLSAAQAAGRAAPGTTLLDAFPIVVGHLGIMHWVCIAFGLMACYRGVEQQGG
ncbi:MAG: hypothetical protein JO250_05670 [Armatimonadetes bacterium]|nr:hypothetical protein [Armatimonadota bacterium]